jgi:hypothetical protein
MFKLKTGHEAPEHAGVIVMTGNAGAGKSVLASGAADFVIRSGGTVLWVDPLGGAEEYFTPSDPLALRQVTAKDVVAPPSVADIAGIARGFSLVVLDHPSFWRSGDLATDTLSAAAAIAKEARTHVLVLESKGIGAPI